MVLKFPIFTLPKFKVFLSVILLHFLIYKALAIVGDLTLQSNVENLINNTLDHFKQLDILVRKNIDIKFFLFVMLFDL